MRSDALYDPCTTPVRPLYDPCTTPVRPLRPPAAVAADRERGRRGGDGGLRGRDEG